ETDALGNYRTWTYVGGLVDVYTDKRGWTKEYTYFGNDLVESETDRDDTSTVVNTKNWIYNDDGQTLTATDDAGTIEWTYDDAGRVETYTGVDGFTQTFDYDAADRLIEITDSLGGDTILTYDDADRLIERDFSGSGTSFEVDYDYND